MKSAPDLGGYGCLSRYPVQIEEHLSGEDYQLAEGLAGHYGRYRVVSHAGVTLIRALAENVGLTADLSKALAPGRLLTYDQGRVLADLAPARSPTAARRSAISG